MKLRPATPQDAQALADLGRISFCAAFEHLYDPADLAAFLAEHKVPEAYARIVADPRLLAMLAEDEGRIVGYCILRLESEYAEHSDAVDPVSVQQVYIDPARTGEGIGAALIEWALDEARERNAGAIQLSVWSGNTGAQRFYRRYGFAKIADIEFWVGQQCDEEFLYEKRLERRDSA